MVVAHRGASASLPENTLPAFRRALELGATHLELDVQATKDGKLIVMHDASVDRTTTGKGLVSNLDFRRISKLHAGPHGEQVPTLEEVLMLLVGRHESAIIEPKTEGLEKPILALIRALGLDKQVLLKSFRVSVLETFRTLAPEIPRIYVMVWGSHWFPFTLDYRPTFHSSLEVDVQYLQMHRYFLSKSYVKKAHELGRRVIAWDVDEPRHIREVLGYGVDGIETDHVDRVWAVSHEKKKN